MSVKDHEKSPVSKNKQRKTNMACRKSEMQEMWLCLYGYNVKYESRSVFSMFRFPIFKYPAALQRYKFDAPLLAAGALTKTFVSS